MFSVSTHARYALRALQYIAEQGDEGYIPISRIAEEEQISKKYLENIFTLLKKGGLLRSVRGPEGGYALAKHPKEISLWDIVTAADGKVRTAECIEIPEICGRYNQCGSKDIWKELQQHIESFLRERSLDAEGKTGGKNGIHGQ